jgi:hypothetical protein
MKNACCITIFSFLSGFGLGLFFLAQSCTELVLGFLVRVHRGRRFVRTGCTGLHRQGLRFFMKGQKEKVQVFQEIFWNGYWNLKGQKKKVQLPTFVLWNQCGNRR